MMMGADRRFVVWRGLCKALVSNAFLPRPFLWDMNGMGVAPVVFNS